MANSFPYPQYDYDRFFERIKDQSFSEIHRECQGEVSRVKRLLFPGRGRKGISKEERSFALRYLEKVGRIAFFIQNIALPSGAESSEIENLRELSENLVKKGQLNTSVLELFENEK